MRRLLCTCIALTTLACSPTDAGKAAPAAKPADAPAAPVVAPAGVRAILVLDTGERIEVRGTTLFGRSPSAAPGEGAATDDDDVPTAQVETVPLDQLDNSLGSARQRAGNVPAHPQDKPPQVRRMQPIGVLRGIDALQHLVRVDTLGER